MKQKESFKKAFCGWAMGFMKATFPGPPPYWLCPTSMALLKPLAFLVLFFPISLEGFAFKDLIQVITLWSCFCLQTLQLARSGAFGREKCILAQKLYHVILVYLPSSLQTTSTLRGRTGLDDYFGNLPPHTVHVVLIRIDLKMSEWFMKRQHFWHLYTGRKIHGEVLSIYRIHSK